MPSVNEHCKISLKRTKGNEDFKELHEWIDKSKTQLGSDHRIERHHYNEPDKDQIKQH